MMSKLLMLLGAATLAAQDLRIEATFNAGILLQCGGERVYLDSFFVGLDEYQKPTEAQLERLFAERGSTLVLATHAHRDHWDAGIIEKLLARNPEAAFRGTSQTAAALAKRFPKQVQVLPPAGSSQWGAVQVELFPLPHSGERWKSLENSGIVVTLCGRRFFHPGDADIVTERFQAIGRVDAAALPYWYFLSPDGLRIVREVLRPQAVWAIHGDWKDRSWIEKVKAAYPTARIPLAFRKPSATTAK